MGIAIERKPASFRLRTDLLATLIAIDEAMSGRNRNKVYASANEIMNDIS